MFNKQQFLFWTLKLSCFVFRLRISLCKKVTLIFQINVKFWSSKAVMTVAWNKHHIHLSQQHEQHWLTCQLSMSLSTKHCLTNETESNSCNSCFRVQHACTLKFPHLFLVKHDEDKIFITERWVYCFSHFGVSCQHFCFPVVLSVLLQPVWRVLKTQTVHIFIAFIMHIVFKGCYVCQ